MKSIIYSILVILVVLGNGPSQAEGKKRGTVIRDSLFTHGDAEVIIGQSARFKDSKSTVTPDSKVYLSAYEAYNKDARTGRTGNIYYLLEQFNDEMSAHRSYIDIKNANAKNGIRTLKGIGNEAYFHSDNENFYFIMVRKGRKVFNMKVNKITSYTSLDAFNDVAKKIASAL